MINKAILVGHLGQDPEVKSMPSGQPVTTFRMATNRKWTDRDGNKQEQTEWHSIVCFGRQAEIAGQYLERLCHLEVGHNADGRADDADRIAGRARSRRWRFLEQAAQTRCRQVAAFDCLPLCVARAVRQDRERHAG